MELLKGRVFELLNSANQAFKYSITQALDKHSAQQLPKKETAAQHRNQSMGLLPKVLDS